MSTLPIELPDELIAALGAEKTQVLAREALLVKLYDLGEISSGRAAQILGITRRAFLDLLGHYNVSEFDDTMNIAEESARG